MPLNPIDGTSEPDLRVGTTRGDLIRGYAGADTLYGNDGRDLIEGGTEADWLYGGYGGDRLFGGDGDDLLDGTFDTDTLYGGAGNDNMYNYAAFIGGGEDRVFGGDGNDFLFWSSDSSGSYHGGRGRDMLQLFWFTPGVAVTVDATAATTAELRLDLTSVEQFRITTGTGDDDITGGRFRDEISVTRGANRVDAGAGNDSVAYVTGAANTLDGGAGDGDMLTVAVENLGAMAFTVTGESATDSFGSTINGFERYRVFGAWSNDTLTTGKGNDVIHGDRGDDVIGGGGGRDILLGQAGNDTLDGGNGADRLNGGPGQDVLTGGDGGDTFIFVWPDGLVDLITDFTSGADTVLVRRGGFGIGVPDGTPAILSYGGPTGTDGQFIYDTQSGELSWDPDGTGSASRTVFVTLSGAPALVAADILLD